MPAGGGPGSATRAMSSAPSRRSRRCAAVPSAACRACTTTSGCAAWNPPSTAARSTGPLDSMIPTDTAPRSPPRTAATASRAPWAAASVARASGSRTAPASVSTTLRRVRSNSGASSSRSSRVIAAETADWTTCARRAPRVKLSSSATATKYSS